MFLVTVKQAPLVHAVQSLVVRYVLVVEEPCYPYGTDNLCLLLLRWRYLRFEGSKQTFHLLSFGMVVDVVRIVWL